jgi:hypothetical protein
MKRRELKIGDIIQVGYNQVRVVHDEKVSCDGWVAILDRFAIKVMKP